MRAVDPSRQLSLYRGSAERGLLPIRRDLAQIQEQMTTGLRVNRPSDDPEAFAQVRALETLQRQHEGYARSIGAARLWTDRTQQELDRMVDLFAQAQEDGLRALNGTATADERAILAGRIDTLLAETIDALNAKAAGDYLFGGTATTAAPLSASGEPTGPLTGEVTRRIGPGLDLAINTPGDRALYVGDPADGGFSVVETLKDLAAALRGEPRPDPADPGAAVPDLAETVGRVERARDHLIALGTVAGETAHRLTLAEDRLEEASLSLAVRRSTVEDTDMIEATMHLQRRQLALEASLRVTASLSQHSLLNYLR